MVIHHSKPLHWGGLPESQSSDPQSRRLYYGHRNLRSQVLHHFPTHQTFHTSIISTIYPIALFRNIDDSLQTRLSLLSNTNSLPSPQMSTVKITHELQLSSSHIPTMFFTCVISGTSYQCFLCPIQPSYIPYPMML